MNNFVNTGMPLRASTERKNDVSVYFMTPELQTAILALSINLIEPGSYDAIRRVVAPSDLAFNCVLDNMLRQNLLFSDGINNMLLKDSLDPVSTECCTERINLLNPLMGSEDLQQEVIHYLNGEDEPVTSSASESQLGYVLKVQGKNLLVGVKPNFLTYFTTQGSLGDFYRNGLELCQTSIPGADLRGTALFAKFVKLAISF